MGGTELPRLWIRDQRFRDNRWPVKSLNHLVHGLGPFCWVLCKTRGDCALPRLGDHLKVRCGTFKKLTTTLCHRRRNALPHLIPNVPVMEWRFAGKQFVDG